MPFVAARATATRNSWLGWCELPQQSRSAELTLAARRCLPQLEKGAKRTSQPLTSKLSDVYPHPAALTPHAHGMMLA